MIATYSWGLLHSHGCTMRYVTAAWGSMLTPTLEVVRTSYRFECGSISRWADRTIMCLKYALTFLFSLCIFYIKCVLLTICTLIFRTGHLRMPNPSPYWASTGPTSWTSQGLCKVSIWCTQMHLTASRRVRYEYLCLHVSAHIVYLVVLTSVRNLQVTWQPYETDEVKNIALNAICKHNQVLWRAELPLICYYVVEWHLPNHVVWHFRGLQTVAG
jgi:hypothetical protein